MFRNASNPFCMGPGAQYVLCQEREISNIATVTEILSLQLDRLEIGYTSCFWDVVNTAVQQLERLTRIRYILGSVYLLTWRTFERSFTLNCSNSFNCINILLLILPAFLFVISVIIFQ